MKKFEKNEVLVTTKMYEKKTKTTYKLISTENKIIDQYHYENGTSKECMRFFKGLGGSFTRLMAYTKEGYKCIRTVSVSADKKNKTIHEYKFL